MGRRRLTIAAIALVAVGSVVAVEFATTSSVRPRPAPSLPTQVLNPPRIDLRSLRGKPAFVNFWASWCHPCREEAPELEGFARSLHGRARLVGVDWSDDLAHARDFVHQHSWTFPVLRDTSEVGSSYGLNGLPTTFVLDARGQIVQTLIGPQTQADLEEALRSVSPSAQVPTPSPSATRSPCCGALPDAKATTLRRP